VTSDQLWWDFTLEGAQGSGWTLRGWNIVCEGGRVRKLLVVFVEHLTFEEAATIAQGRNFANGYL
jgi:hypothetical protein